MTVIDPVKEELVAMLQRHPGRVKIKQGYKGNYIEIHFYGEEDLERLVSLLLPEGLD